MKDCETIISLARQKWVDMVIQDAWIALLHVGEDAASVSSMQEFRLHVELEYGATALGLGEDKLAHEQASTTFDEFVLREWASLHVLVIKFPWQVFLRPSEVKHLYYMEAQDVQAKGELKADGSVEVTGLETMNRSSSGHSVIDMADPAVAKRFPRYAQAKGTSCHVKAGDVLYIPSYWHPII